MTRYHPRSPGARLSALRRALWEEDRASEWLTTFHYRRDRKGRIVMPPPMSVAELEGRRAAFDAARDRRMEAERELWEAMAANGLD